MIGSKNYLNYISIIVVGYLTKQYKKGQVSVLSTSALGLPCGKDKGFKYSIRMYVD